MMRAAALLALAVLSSPSLALGAVIAGDGITVVFAGLCDNATDDEVAFEKAYDDVSAAGGGTIIVPGGKTCRFDADVEMESNVLVECEPGATLRAHTTSSFTNGMFAASGKTKIGFVGCALDMDAEAKPAFYTTGNTSEITFRDNRVSNGSTGAAANYTLVSISCDAVSGTVDCGRFERNTFVGSATDGVGDNGISVAGGNAADLHRSWIIDNTLSGFAAVAISADGVARISGNTVTNVVGATSSSVGIQAKGDEAVVSDNNVTVAGAAARGILCGPASAANNDGVGSRLVSNFVTATGASSIAYDIDCFAFSSSGDGWFLGGTSSTGMRINGTAAGYGTVSGCAGDAEADNSRIHITSGVAQVKISDCLLRNGAYGVVPMGGGAQSDLGQDTINTRVEGTTIFAVATAGVIAGTGWHVNDNIINWLETTGVGILIGDERTWGAGPSAHTIITGNHLHCQGCDALIRIAKVGERCTGGTEATKDCTPGGSSQTCAGAGTCTDFTASDLVITGNEFMASASAGDYSIDFGAANFGLTPYAAAGDDNPDISGVVVVGNRFQRGENAIGFFGTTPSKTTNIMLGANSSGATNYKVNWADSLGTDVLASVGPAQGELDVVSSADQTISSTTLANITGLSVAVLANSIYGVEATLYVAGVTSATDITIAVDCASCTLTGSQFYASAIETTGANLLSGSAFIESGTGSFAFGSGTRDFIIYIDGYVDVSGTGGSIIPQIAWGGSGANFSVKKGSKMLVRKKS